MGTVTIVDLLLEVEVPSRLENLRIVRLVTIDAAERAGMDCDWGDDLRIGVEELCLAVFSAAPNDSAGNLWLRFWVGDGSVIVHGVVRSTTPATGKIALSTVASAILAVVTDDFELSESEMCVRFALVKRSVEMPAVAL
jgi:hypothetical protein